MGLLDRASLTQQIVQNSGLQGQALADLKARLEKMSESELQRELSNRLMGTHTDDMAGIVFERSALPEPSTPQKEIPTPEMGDEQAKEIIIETVMEDVKASYSILTSQDNGAVSDLYDKGKNYFNAELGSDNVKEVLEIQEQGAQNLMDAKEGKLSKREYFTKNREHLKQMMIRRLYKKDENTGIDFLDKNKGNMSKEEFAQLMEEYITEQIDSIQDFGKIKTIQQNLVSRPSEQTEQMLTKMADKAKSQKLALEGKGLDKLKGGSIPPEFDSTEPMKFEDVYMYERANVYNKQNVEYFFKAKQNLDFATAAYNKYAQFKYAADSYIEDYRQGREEPDFKTQSEKFVRVFTDYYANPVNPNLAQEKLKEIISQNNLPIELETDDDGNISLNLDAYQSDSAKNRVLERLMKLETNNQKSRLEEVLGGDIDEKMLSVSQEYSSAHQSAFGNDFTEELITRMEEDNKTVVQRYTGGASTGGMFLMGVGGILCFTPAAPLGGMMVSAGSSLAMGGMVAETALSTTEALTRDEVDLEELDDIKKTALMNAGGFIIGFKAGKAGMKAFNKLIDKKLVEVFNKEITNGNRAQALKAVFTDPDNLKSFVTAAGAKLGTDFLISYAGDLAMMGILDTKDDWQSLLKANLIGVMVGTSGDIKEVSRAGVGVNGVNDKIKTPHTTTDVVAESKTTETNTPKTLAQRIEQAASREDFIAIRDEIKKMPNGEEKRALIEAYTRKYQDFSTRRVNGNDPNRFTEAPNMAEGVNRGVEAPRTSTDVKVNDGAEVKPATTDATVKPETKIMTEDEFIDIACKFANQPRKTLSPDQIKEVIDEFYKPIYLQNPEILNRVLAKNEDGSFKHTENLVSEILNMDLYDKDLVNKLLIADETITNPNLEYRQDMGISETTFEFLKSNARLYGNEYRGFDTISEQITKFDNEVAQKAVTKLINEYEYNSNREMPAQINNIKTEQDAKLLIEHFANLKSEHSNNQDNYLLEEALMIDSPEMKQLSTDLHKTIPELNRISNLMRIAKEGGYEKIRNLLDNPTNDNLNTLTNLHDNIQFERIDNVEGLNLFKYDMDISQYYDVINYYSDNLKSRDLLNPERKLSGSDIYNLAIIDNDTYKEIMPKYEHLIGRLSVNDIVTLKDDLDGIIKKGLLETNIKNAKILLDFYKNPYKFEAWKSNPDHQLVTKYVTNDNTYASIIMNPNQGTISFLKDIDKALESQGKPTSPEQMSLINDIAGRINSSYKYLMDKDIVNDLCLNFEKYGLSEVDARAICIKSADTKLLPFINTLLYDKELNFPKQYIKKVLDNTVSEQGSKSGNVDLAQKLCFDKDFPKDKIASILECARRYQRNIPLIEKLCFDKEIDFPKDKIKDLMEWMISPINNQVTDNLVSRMKDTKMSADDIKRVQGLIDVYVSKHQDEFNDYATNKQTVENLKEQKLIEINEDGTVSYKSEVTDEQKAAVTQYMNQTVLINDCTNQTVKFVREKNQILNSVKSTVKDSNPEFVKAIATFLNSSNSDVLFAKADYHKNKLMTDIMGTYKIYSYINDRPQDYLNGSYEPEIINALKEVRSGKVDENSTYNKLSNSQKMLVKSLNEDVTAYIDKNITNILDAVYTTDTETVKLFLDKRFNAFRGKIFELNNLSEGKKLILADIMRNAKRTNKLGQPDKLTGQQKVDVINLIEAYKGTAEDFAKYKTPVKGRAYLFDIEQLQKDILSDVLKQNGMSDAELANLDFDNINWDLKNISLLTHTPYRDSGELSTVIIEASKGTFKDFINSPNNEHGLANQATKMKFAQNGLNYNAWNQGPAEQKFTVGGEEYTVKLWNRNPQESIFDGTYTTCCTALDGGNGGSMANYLLNTAINVVEIKDASGQTVGMSRCYIGDLDGAKTLVMENIEVNNGMIADMSEKHTTTQLTEGLFKYMGDFADMVIGKDAPVYLSTSYHKIGEEGFRGMPVKSVNKVNLLGNISKSAIYLNTHKGYVDVNEGVVKPKPASFHVVRKKGEYEKNN